MTVEGALQVDGHFSGILTSESLIVVGKSGHVQGDIRAAHMIISGRAEGILKCDTLELINKGEVNGDIYANHVVIQPGCRFFGSSYDLSEAKPSAKEAQANEENKINE
jgi:cytoskeletal protein CcmA (bactofilin family)